MWQVFLVTQVFPDLSIIKSLQLHSDFKRLHLFLKMGKKNIGMKNNQVKNQLQEEITKDSPTKQSDTNKKDDWRHTRQAANDRIK